MPVWVVLTADVTKACNAAAPILQALAAAQRRDKLDRDIHAAENKQDGAPVAFTSSDPDPAATQVARIMKRVGWIEPSPDDVALVRLVGSTIVPSLAGLVLLIANALCAPPPRTKSSQ